MRGDDERPGGLPPLGGHGWFREEPALPPSEAPRYAPQGTDEDALHAWGLPPAAESHGPPEEWGIPPTAIVPATPPPPRRPRLSRRLIAIVSAVLAVVVVAAAVLVIPRLRAPQRAAAPPCPAQSACAAGSAYMAAYAAQKLDDAYALTSDASRQRFNDPKIRGSFYKDAHEYIVNRTSAILDVARITKITPTIGATRTVDATHATLAVHVVLHSLRVGEIAQDLNVPLVREAGQWKVSWSPGLIFTKLDDVVGDPLYQRKVRLYAENAPRGTIYDRDGNALAIDGTAYVVGIVPGQVQNAANLAQVLSEKLGLTPAQVTDAYAGAAPDAFVKVRVLSAQVAGQIGDALRAVPGVQVRAQVGRVYPFGADAAAVTGYVQYVSQQDLTKDAGAYYEASDLIGRAGVEAWGEQYLRPVKGGRLQIVATNPDGSDGNAVATIAARDAVPGADIRTTLSLADQQLTMATLRAQQPTKGSGLVALEPATGAVLALASNPIYDPNDFSFGVAAGIKRLDALNAPYLNRALSSAVPIGSVFKIVTLSAALENGISPTQTFTCNGTYTVPGESTPRKEDVAGGHGTLTAPDALGPSCDVVFWNVSVLLNTKDPNILPRVARDFGYGAPTDITGLPGEVAGLVPDPAWLKSTKQKTWSATDAANLGIGQGDFEGTPLQVAAATAAVANGGKRMQPRLVTAVVSGDGKTLATFDAKEVGRLPLSADHLALLQSSMLQTTVSPRGTAAAVFKNYPLLVAGKTGTAESGQATPHAWFASYAPASPLAGPPVQAKIAIGVVVQLAGFGAAEAAPISKVLLSSYFKLPGG